MQTNLPIKLREYADEDRNFILDSWHQSDRKGGHWCAMDFSEYMSKIKTSYEGVLAKSQVIVACLEDIDWQIFGYCVSEPKKNILWWVYVKSAFRNFGLGQALLMASIPELFTGEDVTSGCHTVKMARYIASLEARNKEIGKIMYDPRHIMKQIEVKDGFTERSKD